MPVRVSGPGAIEWRPLLEGRSARAAIEAISTIARASRARDTTLVGPFLSDGAAGLALFHAYHAAARGAELDRDHAEELLDRAAAALSDRVMVPSLYAGFAGIAWADEHIAAHLPVAGHRQARNDREDDEDPCVEIDRAILELLAAAPAPLEYDLINGLVGIGVHALERMPRPTATAIIERVIDRLAAGAEPQAIGRAFKTAPELLPLWQRELAPLGYYNTGIAHGVPGVIGWLAQVVASGQFGDLPRQLLHDLVAWLFSHRETDRSWQFPSWVAPGAPASPSRVGWCYGDLGVSAALLSAARAAGVHAWEEAAIEIAGAAANDPLRGVTTAGLCHGAAGNGHLFNVLYQATGEPVFEAAARRCLSCALERVDRSETTALGIGFLDGAAGIGLAMLAATSDIEPRWDRALLVRVSTGTAA